MRGQYSNLQIFFFVITIEILLISPSSGASHHLLPQKGEEDLSVEWFIQQRRILKY